MPRYLGEVCSSADSAKTERATAELLRSRRVFFGRNRDDREFAEAEEEPRLDENLQHIHGSKAPILTRWSEHQESRNHLTMNTIRENSNPGSGAGTPAAITTKTGEANPAWEEPVSFPEWHEILALEPLDALTRERFGKAIISYLRYCRDAHERASVAGAKRYLEREQTRTNRSPRPCTGSSSPTAGVVTRICNRDRVRWSCNRRFQCRFHRALRHGKRT